MGIILTKRYAKKSFHRKVRKRLKNHLASRTAHELRIFLTPFKTIANHLKTLNPL